MNTDAALQTALRVLNTVCERKNPNPEDVEELNRIAPIYANLPTDELACKVIHAILEERKKEHAMCAGG